MASRFRMRKGVDVGQVVKKLVKAVLSLYVGGTIMVQIGLVMNNTTSPFYTGLKLIGWTVDTTGKITDTSGAGILSVVGIIAVASVILEFVEFNW